MLRNTQSIAEINLTKAPPEVAATAETEADILRRGMADRQRARFEARQREAAEERAKAEAEAQRKAEKEAREKAEQEAKAAKDRAELRDVSLAAIASDSERLPRVTCIAKFHAGLLVLDFSTEESYVQGKGNYATIGIGLDLIACLAVGMETGTMNRHDLVTVVSTWTRAGKITSKHRNDRPVRHSVTLGALMETYGLTFAGIEYPPSILGSAIEKDMRAHFAAKVTPASGR